MSACSSAEVASFFGNLASMLDDEQDVSAVPPSVAEIPQQLPLAIVPSADAVEIDAAHKVLRDAIGTPQEALARKYLEIVVEKVKARRG